LDNNVKISIEAGWQTFIDSLINPILIIDNKGIILKLNKNAVDFFTESPEAVIGTKFCKFFFGTDIPPSYCPVAKSIKTGEQASLEYQLERLGKWLRINSYPVPTADNKIHRILCIFEDLTELKKIEEEKTLIEDKYKMLFESIYDVVFIIDPNGIIKEVSPSFMQMTGYKPEQIIGKSLNDFDFLTPESRGKAMSELKNIIDGKPLKQEEYQVFSRHGGTGTGEVSGFPIIRDNKITSIILLIHDITKRKETEEALRESEEKYRALADNPLVGFLIIQDGKYVFANDRVLKMHGYTADEIINAAHLSMLHPDYRDESVKTAVQVGKGEKPAGIIEQKRVKKNGEFFWASTVITPIEYLGKSAVAETIIDITEEKNAQEAVKQARDNLEEALNQLERRNQQNRIIIEMRDMIEVTETMKELPPVIISNMKRLFPGSAGALFYRDPEKQDMEKIATWNEFPDDVDKSKIACQECPAYREGHPYIVDDTATADICPSMKNTTARLYTCIPIMERGDVIGLLHIRDGESMSAEARKRLLIELKETSAPIFAYLSLSISNLRLTESLKNQAIKDPLTGLFNRRFLMETFTKEITRASRKKTNISIVMIDIDHFKKFNDEWGHAAGDELLTRLGKFFMENIRGSDIACRYGGEEFVILMPEMNSSAAFNRIDSMRQEVKKLQVYYDDQLLPHIALSMGISEYPTNGDDVDELLRLADEALYKAKQGGRDRVIIA
jgi:diguanylate cyclase (GGDEF)-like protein/PAS domain S-box-containing protein